MRKMYSLWKGIPAEVGKAMLFDSLVLVSDGLCYALTRNRSRRIPKIGRRPELCSQGVNMCIYPDSTDNALLDNFLIKSYKIIINDVQTIILIFAHITLFVIMALTKKNSNATSRESM